MSSISIDPTTISNEAIYKDPTVVSVLKSAAVSQQSGSAELCNCLHVLSRILYNESSHARLIVENAIGKDELKDLVDNKLPQFSNEADLDDKELQGIQISDQAMETFKTALVLSKSGSASGAISELHMLLAYLSVNGEESIFYRLYNIDIQDLITQLEKAASIQEYSESSAE